MPIVTGEAERRLDRARARVRELSAAIHAARGSGDWDGLRAAQRDVLAAERDVARIAGDEYAEELDFDFYKKEMEHRPNMRMDRDEKWFQGTPINPYPLLAAKRASR